MTLCGTPDWCVLFWQWDQFKVLFKLEIGAPLSGEHDLAKQHWQCSMGNLSTELLALVTGPDTYRMIKVDDNFAGATVTHSTIDTSKMDFEADSI